MIKQKYQLIWQNLIEWREKCCNNTKLDRILRSEVSGTLWLANAITAGLHMHQL